MEDHEQNLDDVLDGVKFDISEPEEEPVATEEAEEIQEPAEETEPEQAASEEAGSDEAPNYEEAIGKFQRTGNPHDLPDPLRAQELARQADYTRKMQEIAALRREMTKEPPKEPEGPPQLDLSAPDEDVQRQFTDAVQWAARAGADAARKEIAPIQEEMSKQRHVARGAELQRHVESLEGYTPELGEHMAAELARHFDPVTGLVDPAWQKIMNAEAGLGILFENIRAKHGQAKTQDEAAKRSLAKRRSPPPAKSREAEPLTDAQRHAGLDLDDTLNDIVSKAL